MNLVQGVAAIIVTYNRAEKLERVIKCVQRQTHPVKWILVIDNASTDDTADVLSRFSDDSRLKVFSLTENTGGAGGFAHGMARALEVGADYVWVMDDDCYAEPEALQLLLERMDSAGRILQTRISFAGSLVRWRDGSSAIMNSPRTSDDWGDLVAHGLPATLVQFASFVSLVVPTDLIRQIGLPITEYFIWWDDTEYTMRLSQVGRGIIVHDSKVIHDLPRNEGVNFGQVNDQNLWKFKYGARNESSYRWHHGNKFSWLEFFLLTTVRMNRGDVAAKHRLAVYREVLRGLRFDPAPGTANRDGA